jgi:hypothetical protein
MDLWFFLITVKQMKLFIADIKYILRVPALLCALLSPFIIALILLYGFPLVSGLTKSDDAYLFDRYYSIAAITLISAVPIIYGLIFSFMHQAESHSSVNNDGLTGTDLKWHFKLRMAFSVILSFGMILPLIYLADAVPTEGWLRSIYAAFLLAITAPFIFIFSAGFARDGKSWKILSLISLIFLLTVPSGLLLHHPWNYVIFFSPFYWTGWAWVIVSASESMVYGMISLAITAIFTLICFRHFLRNSGTV